MVDDYVLWRGHRIHVTETGTGDPLLLITGLGSNCDMWAPFMEQFATRRIIRFDAPGCGRSSIPLAPVPVASMSHLASAVLDAYDVRWADVIGFSYGGAVAQQLAADFPHRVRRLVLAATTCGIGATLGPFEALAGLATPLRYYSPTYFHRTARTVFGGTTGRDPVVRAKMMTARSRRPPTPWGYTLQLLGALGWSSLPFLHRIPHETLVICGDDDPLIPTENARLLADRIRGARLEIVEGAGHLFLWDDIEVATPLIEQFVNSGPTGPVDARPS
jgi:poly(3-hydroxyalkanoate) depolymerase